MKRILDVIGSAIGLILLSPVFLIVAALIWWQDRGPVFYRQVRIGCHGTPFRIWKFRTMITNADKCGLPLTVGRDPRITSIGHWLRQTKLDELPQLINVIVGEMSLVGPRPEVKKYVDLYDATQRRVLDLRPGITDLASLEYIDESTLLATADDPERMYIETIMPEKIRINLTYAARANFVTDISVIVKTGFRLLGKMNPFRPRQPDNMALRNRKQTGECHVTARQPERICHS